MSGVFGFIDPYVFATPPRTGADTSQGYLNALVSWGTYMRTHPGTAATSEACVDALLLDKAYPTWATIQQHLDDSGDAHLTTRDILESLRLICEMRPYMEEMVQIRDVACDGDPSVTPEAVWNRLGGATPKAICCSLMILSLAKLFGRLNDAILFVTRPSSLQFEEVAVKASVQMYLDGDGEPHEFAAAVDHVIPSVEDWTSIVSYRELEALYLIPQDAVARVLAELGLPGREVVEVSQRVTADDSFVISLEELGIHKMPSVLDRVYFLAANAAIGRLHEINGASVHPVRTSSAANAEQVEAKDGAKLWRCTVTRHGAGYRMQYWTAGDNIRLQRVTLESSI